MKLEKECRTCLHYEHKRKGSSDYFSCEKGYFNFKLKEYIGKKTGGLKVIRRYPFGLKPFEGVPDKENVPCNLKKFSMYKESKWQKLLNADENAVKKLNSLVNSIQYPVIYQENKQ